MIELIKHFDNWVFIYPEEMEKVFDEYWEALNFLDFNEKECQKRLRSIIKKFPESHMDAYVHISISYRNQKKIDESLHYALTAYLIGKNAFPKEFDLKEDEILWIDLNNRPFLRACQNLGLEYQHLKNYKRAIELYNENLLYNKNDNQGIRYLLLECYLESKDYKGFKNLLDRYNDDYSVEFLYGKVIYDILQNKGENAMELVAKAVECNKHIPSELAKDKHYKPDPYRIPGEPNFDAGIPIGSIQQSYEYWARNKKTLSSKKIREFFLKYVNLNQNQLNESLH